MWSNQKKRSAFTMVEMMVSAAVGSFILGALILGSVTIHRSFYSTNHYAAQINNETRLMDYVAQDLRRAMRVGVIISGTYHKLEDRLDAIKTTPRELAVTETNILAITIPDYYGSNSPDNTKGSAFKSSRYARSTLNTSQTYNSAANALLNGCVPWSDALVTGANGYIRYAPTSASTGLIQVRYYRGPRSARDHTACFFRAEYPHSDAGLSSIPNFTREIAERIVDPVSSTSLLIRIPGSDSDPVPETSTDFLLYTKFTPRYRRSYKGTAGTEECVKVTLRNKRRDE